MGFPDSVAAEAMVACGRSCCICHRFCGTKMELHHIKQKAYGGEDTLENCIPLCFDCHSDMGKADPKHPKGKRYSEEELRLHRDKWYAKVNSSPAIPSETTTYKADIELFQSICAKFDSDLKYWLKKADLGNPHPYHAFDPLVSIVNNCDDPFFEFLNYDLEKWKVDLIKSIRAFLQFKTLHTFATTIGQEEKCVTRQWKLSHTDWLPRSMSYEECSAKFEQEVQILNDLASDVWNAYYVFVQQGRRLLAE